jgi:dihydrofolate reductase
MGAVVASGAMSLDGYVSGPEESGFDHLFAWYGNGDIPVPTAQPERSFRMTAPSAELWTRFVDGLGAVVVGRRTFDVSGGWNGLHPLGVPVVVVTHRRPDAWIEAHPDAEFAFVSDGIDAAIGAARRLAGDRDVAVTAGAIAEQALDAGLLDEVWVMLVPVLLGGGRRFFEQIAGGPIALGDPAIVAGTNVTHLRYPVPR